MSNSEACIANATDSHLYSSYHFNSQQQLSVAMIVCVCRRVSDREIARHAHAGMSFDEIQFELGVAMQCGRCEGCARDVVAQCSATHPIAAIHNEAHACAPVQTVQLATKILESKAWPTSLSSQPSSAV